jgi:hypothetical protein
LIANVTFCVVEADVDVVLTGCGATGECGGERDHGQREHCCKH